MPTLKDNAKCNQVDHTDGFNDLDIDNINLLYKAYLHVVACNVVDSLTTCVHVAYNEELDKFRVHPHYQLPPTPFNSLPIEEGYEHVLTIDKPSNIKDLAAIRINNSSVYKAFYRLPHIKAITNNAINKLPSDFDDQIKETQDTLYQPIEKAFMYAVKHVPECFDITDDITMVIFSKTLDNGDHRYRYLLGKAVNIFAHALRAAHKEARVELIFDAMLLKHLKAVKHDSDMLRLALDALKDVKYLKTNHKYI